MSKRIEQVTRPCARQWRLASTRFALRSFTTSRLHKATSATASASAIPGRLTLPVGHVPITKPPSARPVEDRKAQLIRAYTSLLRTTPLILFFQHSNLTAEEWSAVRRELKTGLEDIRTPHEGTDIAPHVHLQVMRTNMLNVALKLVEVYDPATAAARGDIERTFRGPVVHDLSKAAYDTLRNTQANADSTFAQIEPLMVGPVVGLVFPTISSAHLAAALSILAPVPGKFPAPTRRKNPGYHDPVCQNGLAKLMLIGGRVEGKVFDQAGVNWIGGIEGGLDGLRAQLVQLLQSAGLGLTTALEGGSKSLWLALEGRKEQLDPKSQDEADGKTEEKSE